VRPLIDSHHAGVRGRGLDSLGGAALCHAGIVRQSDVSVKENKKFFHLTFGPLCGYNGAGGSIGRHVPVVLSVHRVWTDYLSMVSPVLLVHLSPFDEAGGADMLSPSAVRVVVAHDQVNVLARLASVANVAAPKSIPLRGCLVLHGVLHRPSVRFPHSPQSSPP
jgi:hypothetical protein